MDLRGLFAQRLEARQSVDRAEADLVASHPGLSEERRAVLWLYARYLRKAETPLRRVGGDLVHEARPRLARQAR